MTEVLRRAKIPKATAKPGTGAATTNGTNGAGGMTGNNAIALSKEWSGGPDGLPDVRIPEVTVEIGVDFLKEKIKDVVEPVEDDSD
jgi:hypothetical protein